MCLQHGDAAGAKKYRGLSAQFIADWQRLANDGDHSRLQYNLPNTFSLKYNIAIQRLLDLKVGFPQETLQQEEKFYLDDKLNAYGTPLDDRYSASL